MAPAAETQRPEGQIARAVTHAGCLDREAVAIGCVSQFRSAEGECAQFTGRACIRCLAHAAEHGAAGELRLSGLRVLHAAEHFAGERIERLPGTVGGLTEQRGDERIGLRACVERARNRPLIACLRHRGKPEAAACTTATGGSSRITERQEHIGGVIAQCWLEKRQIARHLVERAAQPIAIGGGQDRVLGRGRIGAVLRQHIHGAAAQCCTGGYEFIVLNRGIDVDVKK